MPCCGSFGARWAANFYVSVFRNSEILEIARYGRAAPPSRVGRGIGMTVTFGSTGRISWRSNVGRISHSARPIIRRACKRRGKSTNTGTGSRWWRGRAVRVAQGQVRPVMDVPVALGEMMRDGDPARVGAACNRCSDERSIAENCAGRTGAVNGPRTVIMKRTRDRGGGHSRGAVGLVLIIASEGRTAHRPALVVIRAAPKDRPVHRRFSQMDVVVAYEKYRPAMKRIFSGSTTAEGPCMNGKATEISGRAYGNR